LNDSSKYYKTAINYMAEHKEAMQDKLFLELLFCYGTVEYKRDNYTSSIEAFNSFLDYIDKNKLSVDDDTVKKVEKYITMADSEIKGKQKRGGKNIPIATSGTNIKKKTLRGKPYQRLKVISKEDQKADVEKLWKDMEATKMDIEEDSKWYIVSTEWFDQWKRWTGFQHTTTKTIAEDVKESTNNNSDDATKDGEVEEPARIDNYDILDTSEIMLFGEYNLKDNLNEEEDYVIVNPDIWRYLYTIYDGTPILRRAIKNIDKQEDSEIADCIIEVNMVKLFIFEVPRENRQDFFEVMLASRNWDLADVKYRICNKKKIKENDIRLWKIEKPQDLDKFYLELEYEWKKYKTLRIDGQLQKDLKLLVKDADFSRDDFMMIEYQIPTTNENGYALVEVEKKGIKDALNEKAYEALQNDDNLKGKLSDPSTLQFTDIPVTLVSNEKSVMGICGLSNLGNTCFMN
jgi:hypothetical protein